jgi:CBS domain containing-hemolysin-like protein
MARTVRILMYIVWPIAWPIAKLLEYILGAHHGIIYRRSELRELIKMHAAGGEGGGDLDLDTVTMAQGALDLAQKMVKQAMTPIEEVFVSQELDCINRSDTLRCCQSMRSLTMRHWGMLYDRDIRGYR